MIKTGETEIDRINFPHNLNFGRFERKCDSVCLCADQNWMPNFWTTTPLVHLKREFTFI